LVIVLALAIATTPVAQAQTFQVIYNVGSDEPYSGLTMDTAGNLYGTTRFAEGNGSVFKRQCIQA
jgi:hypothetical protein